LSFPIYLSGSISGGKSDVALYRRIVDRLRVEGHEVFDGEVTAERMELRDDAAIFARDMAWIAEVAARGGALVAEVSTPSLGVGYEIASARHLHGIPVICLYRPARARCSGMIAGDPGIVLIRYSEKELDAALEMLVQELRKVGNKTSAGAVADR
jgi:2'-deoxynucleoside 5'-phosphate N-hydrolase